MAVEDLGPIGEAAVAVMTAIGAPGVGLLLAAEALFPPIPSEVILPLAGFAAYQGAVSLPAALAWSTAGSLAGALALYAAGRGLGRFLPVIRSLVSVPAGVERMHLAWFVPLTAAGSLLWNALFILGGYALGHEWHRVAAVADWLQYAVVAALLAGVGWLALRRARRRARA